MPVSKIILQSSQTFFDPWPHWSCWLYPALAVQPTSAICHGHPKMHQVYQLETPQKESEKVKQERFAQVAVNLPSHIPTFASRYDIMKWCRVASPCFLASWCYFSTFHRNVSKLKWNPSSNPSWKTWTWSQNHLGWLGNIKRLEISLLIMYVLPTGIYRCASHCYRCSSLGFALLSKCTK